MKILVDITSASVDSLTLKIYSTSFRLIEEVTFANPVIQSGSVVLSADCSNFMNLASGNYYFIIIAQAGGVTVKSQAKAVILLK